MSLRRRGSIGAGVFYSITTKAARQRYERHRARSSANGGRNPMNQSTDTPTVTPDICNPFSGCGSATEWSSFSDAIMSRGDAAINEWRRQHPAHDPYSSRIITDPVAFFRFRFVNHLHDRFNDLEDIFREARWATRDSRDPALLGAREAAAHDVHDFEPLDWWQRGESDAATVDQLRTAAGQWLEQEDDCILHCWRHFGLSLDVLIAD